jgi:Family of unknown function (DUF5706)
MDHHEQHGNLPIELDMEPMIDTQTIERQLDRVQSFVPRIDARVSALFAIISGQLAIAILNLRAQDLSNWFMIICLVTYLACAIWSIMNLYMCVHPDTDGGERSTIYFVEISKLKEMEYVDRVEAQTEADFRLDLLRQIWRNSQIVSQKYASLKAAGSSTFFGAVPWLFLLAASSIKNLSLPALP